MEYPSVGERTPGKYNETSALDEAIAKYGGKDEKYKLELKKQIRNYLGYANYIGRMNIVDKGPSVMQLPDGPMTPSGTLGAYSGANDLRLKELGYLKQLAGVADTAGDALASKKLADLKDKASKGAKDMFMNISNFTPENDWEKDFQRYMQNPFKENGAFLPLEDYKKMLIQYIMAESPADEKAAAERAEQIIDKYMPNNTKLSENFKETLMRQIKEEHPSITPKEAQQIYDDTIQVLPENIQYEWNRYYYKSLGMTDSAANAAVQRDNYMNGKMSPGETMVYEQTNPKEAEEAKILMANPELQRDLQSIKFEDGSVGISKSFAQLVQDYPQIDPAKLKEIVTPIYQRELNSDADIMISFSAPISDADGNSRTLASYKERLSEATNLDEVASILSLITDSVTFKNQLELLATTYSGVFTRTEVTNMVKRKMVEIGQQEVARTEELRKMLREERPDATPQQIEEQIKKLKMLPTN